MIEHIINYVDPDNNTPSVKKGDAFCEWVLKYVFERLDEDIAFDIELSGKGDNSIDAWFEDNDTLYIIQTKYNSAHTQGGFAGFIQDINRLLKNPLNTIGDNQNFSDFSNTLDSYISPEEVEINDESTANKRIALFYITSSKLTSEFKQRAEHEKNLIESQNSNLTLEVYGIQEITEHLQMAMQQLPNEYRTSGKKLMLKNSFFTGETFVAEVELKHFARFVEQNIKYIFFSNIRNYLRNTRINNAIRDTFQNAPHDFWYYNNGITIICDDFNENLNAAGEITIFAPQIVNGCQTASTIYEEYKNIKDKQRRNELQGGLLIKIIKDKNLKKVDNIIRYTNSQNSVSAMDFFALDDFHKSLKSSFGQLGFYYEIQRKEKQFLNRYNKVETKKYGLKEENKPYKYLFGERFDYVLPVKQVVQAYAAGMHYMPATASSRSGELAPGTSTSKKLFNGQTPKDPLYFLFPFGVMQYAKKQLGYGGLNRDKAKSQNKVQRRKTKQIDFRKNCLMLFVSVYFRLLVHFLKELDYYNKHENDNPLKIELSVLKAIFENPKVNKMLLNTVDSIISAYVHDKAVQEIYQDNFPKFLKTDIQKNEAAIDIMIDKIRLAIEELTDDEYLSFQELIDNTYKQLEQQESKVVLKN